MIQRKGERSFLVRLDEKIQKPGIIEVLRKSVKHFDKLLICFTLSQRKTTMACLPCLLIQYFLCHKPKAAIWQNQQGLG